MTLRHTLWRLASITLLASALGLASIAAATQPLDKAAPAAGAAERA